MSEKTDLKAANAEVRDLMEQLRVLKEDRWKEAREVEAEYARKLANMAVQVRHLADTCAELAGRIAANAR